MTPHDTPFDKERLPGRMLRYRQLNRTIAETLAESLEVHEAIPRILEAIGEGLGWQFGVYWTPDDAAHQLSCAATWSNSEVDLSEFDEDTRTRVFKVGEGVLGAAWEGGEPVWISDISKEETFLRPEMALRAGLKSAIFVPIPTGQAKRRDALIEFLQDRTSKPDDGMVEMLHTISTFIYQYLRLRNAEGHLYNLRGLDIHDTVVQGLVAAKMALEAEQPELVRSSIDSALLHAKRIINELVVDSHTFRRVNEPALPGG